MPPLIRRDLYHRLPRARDWQDRPEFASVCEWWKSASVGVCTLAGVGGSGKTAIVDRFLQVLPGGYPEHPEVHKDTSLRSSSRLFIFSFYDHPSPDAFFEKLAILLGCYDPENSVSIPKYHRILQWFSNESLLSTENADHSNSRNQQTSSPLLLILDGLEKVQSEGGKPNVIGQIVDNRLSDFVRRIADGLIANTTALITTRIPPAELEELKPSLYKLIEIVGLHSQSGVNLLLQRGVKGTHSQLINLVKECGYHALTIDLAGGYISEFGECSVSSITDLGTSDEINDALKNEPNPRRRNILRQEYRFVRIVERYREGLAKTNPAALALLERLCLLHIGADLEKITAIFTGDNKEAVSGPDLARMSKQEVQNTLDYLVELRLVFAGNTNYQFAARAADDNMASSDTQKNHRFTKHEITVYSVHPAIQEAFVRGIDADKAMYGHKAIQDNYEATLSKIPGVVDNPSSINVLNALEGIVRCSVERNNFTDAYRTYWRRIGNYLNLGVRLGEYDRGERICRMLLKQHSHSDIRNNPRLAMLNVDRALYLAALGRGCDSISICREIIAARHHFIMPIAYQNLAMFLIQSGRLIEAHKICQEAVRFTDRRVYTRFLMTASAYSSCLIGNIHDALTDISYIARDFSEDRRYQYAGGAMGAAMPIVDVAIAAILVRLGNNDLALQIISEASTAISRDLGNNQHDLAKCFLLKSNIAYSRGNLTEASNLLENSHEWALAHDAKELLCWAAVLRVRINFEQIYRGHCSNQAYAKLQRDINDGLRIALDCGFSIYFIDLMLLKAKLALCQGRTNDAMQAIISATEEGIHREADSRLPTLLAANDTECSYLWGIAEGKHLLGETLLLKAAQQLGQATYNPERPNLLSMETRDIIERGRIELESSLTMWRQLKHPETNGDINPYGSKTGQVLNRLSQGMLTTYPLLGSPDSTPIHYDQAKAETNKNCVRKRNFSQREEAMIEIFFSYAHEDETLMDEVRRQLIVYERQGRILKWHDRKILPGVEWQSEIDERLRQARVILLFMSPRFIESKYCYQVEGQEALRRHDSKEAIVIPVILRPCAWEDSPFGELQALPCDGKPVSTWDDLDVASLDVARGVMSAVDALIEQGRDAE